jgi:hypothetical protein
MRPVWSRTASELFFSSLENRIMVTRYKTGAKFVAEKPRVWSNTQVVAVNPPLTWTFDLAPGRPPRDGATKSNIAGRAKGIRTPQRIAELLRRTPAARAGAEMIVKPSLITASNRSYASRRGSGANNGNFSRERKMAQASCLSCSRSLSAEERSARAKKASMAAAAKRTAKRLAAERKRAKKPGK